MIEALNNQMLFGALRNLRLAPHVREGQPVAVAPRIASRSAVAPKPTSTPVSTANPPSTPAIGQKLQPDGEKLTLSPAALAAHQAGAAGPAAPPSFQADAYGAAGAPLDAAAERPVLPLTAPAPLAATAAMAVAAAAYREDFSAPAARPTLAAPPSSQADAGALRSALGVLRA